MPKVYQAYYRDGKGWIRYHGSSRGKVEAEAKGKAQEVGRRVHLDVVEFEALSLKWLIQLLNGDGVVERCRLVSYVPHGERRGGKWSVNKVEENTDAKESSFTLNSEKIKECIFETTSQKEIPPVEKKKSNLSPAVIARLKKLKLRK